MIDKLQIAYFSQTILFMKNSRTSSLVILVSIFFFWGFVAASNGILIPLFKEIFHLTQFQSQLVDLSFYIAYFVGSLIYFFVSVSYEDPLHRIGYKKGLIIGLLISAIGAIGFIPAANMQSYPMLLSCMFIIGLGFTLQQIVANPYVIALGDQSTGAHRLNMAAGVNSFGTTIGPVLLSLALFGQISSSYTPVADISAIKLPCIILCSMLLLSATVLAFSSLPPITQPEKAERKPVALQYPQLTLGMLAIFFYVGVEVTIQSNMGALLKLPEIKGLSASQISPYISLYWGSLMIGRWRGSVTVFNLKGSKKTIVMTLVPLVAFAVICAINYLRTNDISDYKFYVPYIVLGIIAFFIGAEKPARTLMLFSIMAACMMLVGLFTTGDVALFSFISGGLFCSVMWPCIFALAISGLGKYTTQGSSLLIMMILGGALIPPLQGKIVDLYGAHVSYWVPVVCFAYLDFYGWRVSYIFKQQGMDANKIVLEEQEVEA